MTEPMGEGKKRQRETWTTSRIRKAAAVSHGIPNGYALQLWDPDERPVIVAGTVFDANSFGKWLFDWTVHRLGSGRAPIAEMCGQLWLLLIQFCASWSRAEGGADGVSDEVDREMVMEFIEAGDRVWSRFTGIVDRCADRMWPVADADRHGCLTMGKECGVRFVDTMFGREWELEAIENWMARAQLWLNRFDANCAAILHAE